jgi:hypothetical protein
MKLKRMWMIVVCLMALSGFQCGGKGTVPEDLIGVWETTSPAYADRFFEITSGEVIFATGERTSDSYPISKIKIQKDPIDQKAFYIICYKNIEGQEYKFSFYYDPANQGKIRFKNQQDMVWTKRTSSPASN